MHQLKDIKPDTTEETRYFIARGEFNIISKNMIEHRPTKIRISIDKSTSINDIVNRLLAKAIKEHTNIHRKDIK